jgi:hypothetical protein
VLLQNRKENPPSRIWSKGGVLKEKRNKKTTFVSRCEGGRGCVAAEQKREPSVSHLEQGRGVEREKKTRKPLRLALGAREEGW